MLQLFKKYVPQTIKENVKRGLAALRKPDLPYVELHLTDHCNLDCKGCGHFSPIAAHYFAEIGQYQLDMRSLSRLFHNIGMIRLMGGEPLLHPDAASFIAVTRKTFPLADIRLVTNGILLATAPESFWTTCRDTRTTIDLTVYPPLRGRAEDLLTLCKSRGVTITTSQVEEFHAHLNLTGNSDARNSFESCRSQFFCPFLRDGRLYHCGLPALIHHFNKGFNYRIPSHSGIDIHSRSLSGRQVLQLLDRPIPNCSYCSSETVSFPWGKSELKVEEWDVEALRNVAANTVLPEAR